METQRIAVNFHKTSFNDEGERSLAEDECDNFLNSFYDFASPRIAERLGYLVGNRIKLSELEEASILLILWKQTSRSATLALLDSLISNCGQLVLNLNAEEWSRHCLDGLDFERFKAETSLCQDDARIAIKETAVAAIEYLQKPKSIFYRECQIEVQGKV
ncbi:MAG: hypothetical protein Q8R55_06855 [Candidatus Taylorbacteria bacterium]|nr:hypothetical protein [Candidatus Taylorbacteria bacterium]